MNEGLEELEKCIMQLEEDNKLYNSCQDVRKMKLCLMKDNSILSALCVYNNETPHLEDEVEITFKDYETAKKYLSKLKALDIISQNFKLVGNCLHAKNKYAESGWVFVKELEDEEEHNAWKEVLL